MKKEVKQTQEDIENLNQKIEEKEKAIKKMIAEKQENDEKLKRIDAFIENCEKLVKRMVQTSLGLEKLIDKVL